ncbi:hypothetical protein PsYK624_049600 [Phanerochaete sordida]|uniref:Uncharacterized protein n=1 Tax=Phanerochaete sordida TaxID=48140 RepID=A0A9P3LC75_9APHY|nr:hypothetical protein PsYK624_049600 [Phanerochaete sordida]
MASYPRGHENSQRPSSAMAMFHLLHRKGNAPERGGQSCPLMAKDYACHCVHDACPRRREHSSRWGWRHAPGQRQSIIAPQGHRLRLGLATPTPATRARLGAASGQRTICKSGSLCSASGQHSPPRLRCPPPPRQRGSANIEAQARQPSDKRPCSCGAPS